ncbi:hypothetical protein ET445_01190 [Agromyces protaetiae]|uniref:Lipoprotein n=1 Tax=Agromyces protaetiae TaxID=2509455 RepID=A0A4P6F8R8_9MICO|nr:hypothetical protein [Agromyces protaetiae]QAY72154.1 hypothetical protein ET445_01190 [Agromyces protaetiae]
MTPRTAASPLILLGALLLTGCTAAPGAAVEPSEGAGDAADAQSVEQACAIVTPTLAGVAAASAETDPETSVTAAGALLDAMKGAAGSIANTEIAPLVGDALNALALQHHNALDRYDAVQTGGVVDPEAVAADAQAVTDALRPLLAACGAA